MGDFNPMKLLFIIQGEGRGHLTQAVALRQKLLEEGHQLVGVMVGKSKARRIPDFFVHKMGMEILTFESPNFLPTPKNRKHRLARSICFNLLRLHTYLNGARYINRVIRESEAEVVVNFYELLTGLAYALYRPRCPMVCVAHQYLFLHPEFKFPDEHPLSLAMLRLFTRLTAIGASRKIALSFRDMADSLHDGLYVAPPLLREEIFHLPVEKGDYLHGYILNDGYDKEVVSWHKKRPDVPLHFFWDKNDVPEEVVIDKGLSFHRINDVRFLRYLAGAKAYATTAGFESVCEAMYLGKPVLMVPAHIEQACNAHDAMFSGAGRSAGAFDLDLLLDISQTYQANREFKRWADQADWRIKNLFREETFSPGICRLPRKKTKNVNTTPKEGVKMAF
jgi:uncharacterized protein (TIGR00661 family)